MKLTRNKKLLLGLIALVIISTVYLMSSVRKSPPPASLQSGIESTNPEVRNTAYQKISLADEVGFPSVPQTLPVFSQNKASFNLFGQSQKLARYFDLLPVSGRSGFWLSKDKKSALFIDSPNQILTFQVDSFQSPESYTGKAAPTAETAAKSAQDFVNSFENWKDFKTDINELVFFKEEGAELIETNIHEASVISVSFSQSVNDIPVRIGDQTEPPLVVSVGQKNQIIKIVAHPQIIDLSSPKEYSTISQKEAMSLLDQKQGKIIQLAGKALVESSTILKEVSQITILSVGLEYRLDTKANLLVPYYNLMGSFFFGSSSVPSTVILVLPAVKL